MYHSQTLPLFIKRLLCLVGTFALAQLGKAQEVPFSPRLLDNGDTYINIKGDYTFLSNSVMNRIYSDGTGVNDPYNGGSSNNSLHIEYVDIDSDPTTYSSSSSTLTLPDCSQIYWAGLYWAGNYDYERWDQNWWNYNYSFPVDYNHYDVTSIKFQVPGGSYVDLQADNNPDPVGEEDEIIIDGFNTTPNDPYVCFKNVTGLLQAMADPSGEYTVANVRGTRGATSHGAAGWTLVVIYENPTLPGKYISVFDGYEGITTQSGNSTADINISGFNTIPVGPVNARIGVSSLEGETSLSGDTFGIISNSSSTFTDITNAANPSNNFFNSTISEDGVNVATRNINSTNAIGFDSDVFDLNNPGNSIIDNGDTSATLRLGTSGDWFSSFLVTFAVEIIEPTIILEKKVEDIGGNDITGQGVNLGQYLDYVLSFVNTGNDDATNYTIRDVLPINVTLDESNITLPTGVTYVYNSTTREITFTVADNLVEIGDPISEIRMRVQVAENCFDFVDACTDQIENVAYSTYEGVINDNQITDDPSVSDFDDCGFTTPGATNFLLDDLENCNYTRTVQLCGADVLLDAGNNFDSYTWYVDENGNNQIDAGDTVITDSDSDNDPSTILVDEPGTYIVDKEVADPCKGFQEIIIVELFGATQTNPITTLINDTSNTVEGSILTCPNDGEELPEVFLCGLNDSELIQINIPDADSIVWEQLDTASCSAATPDCANKNNTCTWNNVGSGNSFLASDAGEYRLQINYQNGCFSRFYFNVYKNPLDPQFNSSDIVCNTLGNITVTNMPVDYEFQLVNASNGNIVTPYNSNPSFDIATNGAYRVEMRQQGVAGGCVFVLDNIGILERNFQVDVDPKDTDCNGLGEISISVLDVNPQYYYEISQGGTTVDTFGPSNDNNYTFTNLNDGVYDILVTTDDGCNYTEQVTINDVTDLAVSAVTTKAIDCTDGVITVTGTGGFPNPDYFYAIWSYVDTSGTTQISYTDVSDIPGGAYQILNDFTFTAAEAGDYVFVVVDGNNCSAISNAVSVNVAPAVEYTTSQTDETCFGAGDGTFAVNVTNSNGYTLSYELTFPDTSTVINSSGSFTDLPPGDYSLAITQTQGAVSCDYIETFTIGGPADLPSATAVLLQDYTCLQDGSIEAQNVTGGTAPYEFSIDGVNFNSGAGAETFTNLKDGSYTITVRDANGCTVTTNAITFDPLVPPSDLTFTATAATCPANTSDVTVTAVNGEAPFVFEIIAPSSIAATSTSGSAANFDDLAPGTYTFRVTDDKGCDYDESFTVDPVVPIVVTGQLISNITCFGDANGAISFTVSGFSGDYDYSVSGPTAFNGSNETNTTLSFNTLGVGTYAITITDNTTNCSDTASVTVSGPSAALTITANETQPTCLVDGGVVLSSGGGWGGNTFELINPDSTPFGTNATGTFNNLTQSGTYSATVTDANGCSVSTTFNLSAAVAPVLQITPNNTCYDNAVGLTLTANVTSGGDGNFEYSLNGGAFDVSNTFSGLGPGTYTVVVMDGNDCTDTASITINPELSVVATAPNITACTASTDITITAAGGDNNYVYAVVGDGVSPAPGDFSTTNPVNVTSAGDYDVYVRDNNGGSGFCEASFDISIAQDAPLVLSISNSPILCSGESQATITVGITGGEGPYLYSIDNGVNYQTSNTFVNQPAGSYTVRVQDANNCEVSEIYAISEPLTLSASAAVTQLAECNPGVGAEVRITNVLGGTSPYEYSFDGGSNYVSSPINFLLPGSHTVYVRDANNCIFPMSVTVDPEPTAPNAATSVSYECDGEGTITVTPDSALFDYTYALDGTPNTPDTSNIFSDVTPGNHTITINYTSNTAPTPSILLSENFGQGTNTPIAEIDAAYCYEAQDGSVSACGFGTDTHIQDGEYSVTQVITNPYGPWRSPNDHTGNANGRFLAINVGGVAGPNGIVYAKRNVEIVPNRPISVSLEAFNLLRGDIGNSQDDPNLDIQLVNPSTLAVIASTTTGLIPKNMNADDWYNYTVSLNPGGLTNIDIVIRTLNGATSGNDVAIDDIQATQTPEVCSSSITVNVQVDPGNAFGASVIASENISCNGVSDGSITFEVENFDAVNGFEYSINGGAFSAAQTTSPITISGMAAGAYTIEVRDVLDNSCSTTINRTLTEPAVLEASASLIDNLSCTNGGGTISASATGGTPSYEYQLEDGVGGIIAGYDYATNGNNTLFTGLAAGDYIVRVQDLNGCEDPIDVAITITNPAAIAFTTTATTCYSGANDATIQVDVTSGNGDYQFRLDGGSWITPTPATATSHTFTNLSAGTYAIEVRDSFGCPVAPNTQNVTIAPQLTGSASLTTDLTCSVDASVTITAAGGSGTYSYEWSSDGGTSFASTNFTGNVFTTNTFGIYVFRITDTTAPTACAVVTNQVVVTEAQTPIITNVVPADILCNGESTGSLDVIIDTSVGTPPYVINVVETSGPTNYGTQTTGLPAGSYEVTITDDKGCTSAAFPVTISQPDPIVYTTTDVPITCNSGTGTTNPGEISISGVAGGTAEYTYTLTANNGIAPQTHTTTPGNRDHTFTVLEFGIYQVNVVDANGCSSFTTEIIASPPNDLDIDVSTATADCTVGGTAIVTVGSAVGSGNYQFAILETYSAPYSTGYVGPDPLPVGNTDTATFTGLTPGITYTFVVYDVTTNCYYFEEAAAPINTPSSMVATLDAVNNVSCTGSADGNISFTFSGFDALATDVQYEIFNRQSNLTTGHSGTASVNPPASITVSNFATLPPGEYYLLLTEVGGPINGCSVDGGEFTIRESVNALDLDVASPNNDNCNPNAGIITATGRFGTAPYEYQYLLSTDPAPTATSAGWVSASSANVEADDYIVYVKDAYGCIFQRAITVDEDPNPDVSLGIVDECVAEGAFEVMVTLNNPALASAPFQISVNGNAYQNFTFNGSNQYLVTGLSSGLTQSIAVRDLNGCEDVENFDIQSPIQFTAALTTSLDCEVAPANNAEITINVTAGSGNYDYEITGPVNEARTAMGGSNLVWTNASIAGNYTVTVYDTSTAVPNCLGSVVVNVPAALAPIFTETHEDVSCNGANDGSITLYETDNGIVPLSYSISPAAGTFNAATNTFENLPGGTYTITATGTNSCTTSMSGIFIDEPNTISVPAPMVVDFGCAIGNNPDNATITVDPSGITGGSGTYVVYEFIDTNGTPTTADDGILQSGPNNVFVETNLADGNYIINVYDDNGCVGSTTASIVPLDQLLTATAAVTNPLSCNPGSDGEITITVTTTNNDLTRLEYSNDNGATWQNTGTHTNPEIFTGLGAGTHNFLIRHLDTGCVISTSETIADPDTFTIDVNVLNDVVCFGTQTGQVAFELIDATYSGPIAWEVFNTNGTPTITADDVSVATGSFATNGPTTPELLLAGSYYVEVTQSNFPGCANIEAFTIAGPSATITAAVSVEEITCVPGNDGVIEIINAQGGWGNYSYYVSQTANPDPNDPTNYVSNPRFDNLTDGTYEIWVIDQNGCPEQLPNETLSLPSAIVADLQINNYNCINLEGEIEVVGIPSTSPVSGGQGNNYTYQLILNGSNAGSPQTSSVFSNLGAGTYQVYVQDQWGCNATVGPVVLTNAMAATTSVDKEIDCTVVPGGTISVNVTGGSGNFDYQMTVPNTGAIVLQNNNPTFTGLTEVGEYVFLITDLDTGTPCTYEVRQTLDAPMFPTLLDATIENISCNGGADGSITAILDPSTDANPPYQYELVGISAGAPNRALQNSPLFDNLPAGDYQVRVVSSRGCEDTKNETITEPALLSVNASATPFVCGPSNTTNASVLTVTASNGTPPYLYSIDNINFQTEITFNIVDSGVDQNITVYVEDANGCGDTASVLVETINSFTLTASQNTAISCANPEELLLTVSDNGNPGNSYTFELLPATNPNGSMTGTPTNTTAIFELTEPGNYTFRATDNATGCYQEITYIIAPYDLIDVVATGTAAAICFGDTNGALEINVAGYSGAYNYEVFTQAGSSVLAGSANTSANPHQISGLSGGNYYVRVTQTGNPLCVEDSNVVTINSPDSPLTATPSEVANVTCTNDQGEVEVSPQGGYAPYTIVLTNTTTGGAPLTVTDVSSMVFTNLSAGNYTVQVTDNGGCVVNENIVLTQPNPISADINATPTNLACFGDTNASVSALNVIGGEGVYQYRLNEYDFTGTSIVFSSGWQSNPVFDNLGAGTYSISVADGWGCGVETAQVTITEPNDVQASLVQLSPLTCNNQAQLELTASGGTAPYEYSLDGNTWNTMSGSDTHTFNVAAGSYQYFVRDSFGCEAMISNGITIDEVPALTIDIDDSAAIINCTGEATATIVANTTGGLGSYSFELYSDAALTNLVAGPQTSDTFSGLLAGSYYIRVTSMDCVAVSPEVFIEDPAPLQIDRQEATDVTCSGLDDGVIVVEVSGGTGEIFYAITPNLNQFDTENTFTDLEPGVYDVIAQDENGCFIPFQFTIGEPEPISAEAINVLDEVCEGSEDGSFELEITGGTAPYSTSLNSNDNADYVQNQMAFSNLAAGTYVVFIKDAQDCETNIVVDINPGVNLNATVSPAYLCTGNIPENQLDVIMEDTSVLPDVLFAIDSTDPADMVLTSDFTNLTPGDHYLTIAHANGCINTIDFEIEAFEPLTLVLEQNNINEITAVASGGVEEYAFYFGDDNNGSDNTYFINRTDTYTVRVIDQNGCEMVAEIFMEFIDVEIPNFFTPDGDGQNDTWTPDNLEAFPEALTIIFDRYGRELYRMKVNDAPWNGIYQNHDLPSGDYWYVLKLNGENDGREFIGHFTLYR